MNDNHKMKAPDANDIHRAHGAAGLRAAFDRATRTPITLREVDANADSKPARGGHLVVVNAASIKPEAVQWLWTGRLARGKHTCIAGEPGTAKSQVTIAITAAITTGGEWPCGEGRAPLGNVIILNAEDGAADSIVPRLMAAGADLCRVHVVSAVHHADARRAFNLQHDLHLLEKTIAEIGNVALVVIDPVSAYLGRTDSHNNSEVRGVLGPLTEMAERNRVAILSVTHFSKGGPNATKKAIDRFIGSVAFVGAPRAAFAAIADPDHEGRLLFLPVKNNLARPPQGLAYRTEERLVDDGADGDKARGIPASRVVWEDEPVTITPTKRWRPTQRPPKPVPRNQRPWSCCRRC